MICKSCNTQKSAPDFYASNKTRCKECVKEAVKSNRLANIERYREFDRMRASMPHRVAARAAYQETHAFSQSHRAAAERWAAKHPDRRKASHIVNNAVRDGVLQRSPCWVCGSKAHAHHPDYSRPLDVVWLCPAHHREAHAVVRDCQ